MSMIISSVTLYLNAGIAVQEIFYTEWCMEFWMCPIWNLESGQQAVWEYQQRWCKQSIEYWLTPAQGASYYKLWHYSLQKWHYYSKLKETISMHIWLLYLYSLYCGCLYLNKFFNIKCHHLLQLFAIME